MRLDDLLDNLNLRDSDIIDTVSFTCSAASKGGKKSRKKYYRKNKKRKNKTNKKYH